MAVETLTTPRSNLPNTYTDVNAREIDFVTRFGMNWQALLDIIGIARPIKKTPGTFVPGCCVNIIQRRRAAERSDGRA